MGICLLLQIRVSDGRVADTYMIQDDFVHLNHSNAPHLYEDRLVILGVSPLPHRSWDALSNACMHIFTLFVRSAPASITRPSAGGLHGLLHLFGCGSNHSSLCDVCECHRTDTSNRWKAPAGMLPGLTHGKTSAAGTRLVSPALCKACLTVSLAASCHLLLMMLSSRPAACMSASRCCTGCLLSKTLTNHLLPTGALPDTALAPGAAQRVLCARAAPGEVVP